jgi:hypothetical protein
MLEVEMSREVDELSSIFMTSRLKHLLVAVMIVLQFAVINAALAQDNASVSAEVKKLGMGESDDVQIVKRLSTTPQLSARLLVKELHPVTDARLLAGENKPATEHVLWCIRALRYITGGLEFCGKTNHDFGTSQLEKNRKYWLYFKSKSCVPFFAVWPSRGSEYIAPEDAQKVIISKWKNWFVKQGASFDYKPLHDPKPEEWLW